MKLAQEQKVLQGNQFLVHIKWSGKVTVVRLYLGKHLKNIILSADRIKHRYPVAESSSVLFVTQQESLGYYSRGSEEKNVCQSLEEGGTWTCVLRLHQDTKDCLFYLDGGSVELGRFEECGMIRILLQEDTSVCYIKTPKAGMVSKWRMHVQEAEMVVWTRGIAVEHMSNIHTSSSNYLGD